VCVKCRSVTSCQSLLAFWCYLVVSCGVTSKYSRVKRKSGMNRTLKVISLSKSGSGSSLSSLINVSYE
jgi:hypothetical protein